MTTFKFPAGVTVKFEDNQYWAMSPQGKVLAELFLPLAEGEDEGDYVETSLTFDGETLMIYQDDYPLAMQELYKEEQGQSSEA